MPPLKADMWTYSRDQLTNLDRCGLRVTRHVRKTKFRRPVVASAATIAGIPATSRRKQSADARPPPRSSPTSAAVRYGLLNAWSIGNKSTTINSIIDERQLDGHGTLVMMTSLYIAACRLMSTCRARPTAHDRTTKASPLSSPVDLRTCRVIAPPREFSTFEFVCFSVTGNSQTVVNLLLFRPGSAAVTEAFFTELTTYLEVLALYKCQIVIAGDFNIHHELLHNPAAKRLSDIMSSFDCVHHVPAVPSHVGGGTIDLVFTKAGELIDEVLVDPPGAVSDHIV